MVLALPSYSVLLLGNNNRRIAAGLQTGLISYWKLDEASSTRADQVGGNTLTDNATVTGNPGPSALMPLASQFTAANSEYLSHADSAALSTGNVDFTVCAWVYLDSEPAASMNIATRWAAGNQREFELFWNQSNNRFAFSASPDGTTTGVTTATANAFGAIATAQWYFVVAWHDSVADTLNIEVNASAMNSAAYSAGLSDQGGQFELGREQSSTSRYWDGRMAGVGFWKRVLTTQERKYLFGGGLGRAYLWS